MGSNVTKEETEVVKQFAIDASVDYLTKNVSASSNTVRGDQFQKITMKGSTLNCKSLNITQDMEIENKVYRQVSVEQEAEFQAKLESELKAEIENIVKQQNEGLNLLQSNVNISDTSLFSSTVADLSKTISREIVNKFNNDVIANQNQEITFEDSDVYCDEDGAFFTQSLDIKSIVEDVMKSRQIDQSFTEAGDKIEASVKKDTTMENTGIQIWLPIIIIIIFILGGVGIYFLLKKLGKLPFRNRNNNKK